MSNTLCECAGYTEEAVIYVYKRTQRNAFSWQTYLQFIKSLYSRSEAEVAYIASKRRLPILIDKKIESNSQNNINNEEMTEATLSAT